MDLERGGPVLEVVLDLDRLGRQLSELAHRDEARSQAVGQRRREDEPAGLHPDHQVDLLPLHRLRHAVDHLAERIAVAQQGGDVVEEDPRLREVGHLADLGAQVVGGASGHRALQMGQTGEAESRPMRPAAATCAALPGPTGYSGHRGAGRTVIAVCGARTRPNDDRTPPRAGSAATIARSSRSPSARAADRRRGGRHLAPRPCPTAARLRCWSPACRAIVRGRLSSSGPGSGPAARLVQRPPRRGCALSGHGRSSCRPSSTSPTSVPTRPGIT